MRTKLCLIALLLLPGCATAPWAVVDGDSASTADELHHDVTIFAIDGQSYPDGRTHQKLAPGFHQVQVKTTKAGTQGDARYRSLVLITEPCVRYDVVAQYKRRADIKNWTAVINARTPISDCTPPKR